MDYYYSTTYLLKYRIVTIDGSHWFIYLHTINNSFKHVKYLKY
jgi:hypothetical protein